MAEDSRVPVTAIVASRNEAEALERCLPSLRFCDEILVVDLESEDDTAGVALRHGADVVGHRLVPIAEWARVEVAPHARHDWLLFSDPDEVLPTPLAVELARLLPGLGDDVGVVFAPMQYYFGNRPLVGTVWGGLQSRRLLVRRNGVELTPTIWGGTRLRDGYAAIELPRTTETAIAHYWVRGYRDWLAKHRRYLALEPGDRARQGQVTGYRAVLLTPWKSFRESFLARRGYRDGVTGLVLSVLWAWFRTRAEIGLLRELRRRAAGS